LREVITNSGEILVPIVLVANVEHSNVLLALVLMLVAAKVLAEVFERLRQPAVVGEILAGGLLGPSVLAWVQPSDFISLTAEIGVIFRGWQSRFYRRGFRRDYSFCRHAGKSELS
jgi:hypothetical protein